GVVAARRAMVLSWLDPTNSRGRDDRGRPLEYRSVRELGDPPQLQKLRGVGRARTGAAGRYAGPREARERAGAREPDPAALHRPRVRQLRRPEDARGCAIYFD